MKPECQNLKNSSNRVGEEFARRIAALTPEKIRLISEAITKKHSDNSMLQQEFDDPLSTVQKIRATGTKRPIFLIHPAGGGTECYYELAKYLDEDRPVYAFQGHVFGSKTATPYLSVEEMAERYIQSLAIVQSEPPYLLAGWSLGGLIAFEMAVRCERRGLAVSLVALLDTPSRFVIQAQAESADSRLAKAIISVGESLAIRTGRNFNVDWTGLERLNPTQQLDKFLRVLRTHQIISSETDDAVVLALLETFRNHFRALEDYSPRMYSGRVAILRASEATPTVLELTRDVYDDPSFGWQAFCSQKIDVRFVPGDHLRMALEPNIRILGATLQSSIDES